MDEDEDQIPVDHFLLPVDQIQASAVCISTSSRRRQKRRQQANQNHRSGTENRHCIRKLIEEIDSCRFGSTTFARTMLKNG